MALHQYLLLGFIISSATFQESTSSSCREGEYYNQPLRRCCGICPEDKVNRSACIQNREKDCAKRCDVGYFINWDRTPPQCATCNKCAEDDHLVEIQSCSWYTEAVCQCQDGYYCHSPLEKTCARCERHRACPPGQGVKTKGTSEKNTECEACPPGSYSDSKSSMEKCEAHTDCDKLGKKTLRKGNSMADAVCETSGSHHSLEVTSSQDNIDIMHSVQPIIVHTLKPIIIAPIESPTKSPTVKEGQRYTTPGVHTVRHIPETPIVSFPTTSTKDEEGNQGKWNGGYIAAVIICILIPLVALVMVFKQKLRRLKKWIKKKTQFIQPKQGPNRTVIIHQEDSKKQISRQNSAQSLLVNLESYQRMEEGHTEQAADDKTDMQQGRDLSNRIEKIYIMNADTVFVGSISEVPGRFQRPVTVESEEKENLGLESRYPEQESSKVPAYDLMLSVEEEESEGTTAKVILQG